MANLSAAARKKIPSSQFGVPSKAKSAKGKAASGSFPMPDRAHAVAAKRLVGRSVKAGNTSPAQATKIKAKANRILKGK